MDIANYTKKLSKKRLISLIAIFALVIIGTVLPKIPNAGQTEWSQGEIHGAWVGLVLAFIFLNTIRIIRITRALRDSTRIQQLFVKHTDERSREIERRAFHTTLPIVQWGLILGIPVAGYFHEVVFWTLLGVALFLSVVLLGAKGYYHKKF